MIKKEKYMNIPREDIFYDLDMPGTASVYEFTGAIPRPPVNETEKENYKELLNLPSENPQIFDLVNNN